MRLMLSIKAKMTFMRNMSTYSRILRKAGWKKKWDNACEWCKERWKEILITVTYNVPLVKTQMKKIIVTAKTLYSHPKNVSKIYAALHTDLAW